MAITVNGLSLEDGNNYIVEQVSYRSIPKRVIISQPLSRRPGDKLTGSEWANKEINIKGRVFGTSANDLRDKVDVLQQNMAVQSLALAIDTDRSYTATLTQLNIPTQFFNVSMASFDATFLCLDPFAYGTQLTASGTVVSGTVTYSGTLTVSGTVFAEPTLTIIPKGANAGNSGIKIYKVTHTPTAETMTVSGTLNYAVPSVIDYDNFYVTISGVNTDYTGIFSRWEPGNVNYTITVTSGVKQGYNYIWAYRPRYYQ